MKVLSEAEAQHWLKILEAIFDIVDTKRNRFNTTFLESVRLQIYEKRRLSEKQMLAIMNIAEGFNIIL